MTESEARQHMEFYRAANNMLLSGDVWIVSTSKMRQYKIQDVALREGCAWVLVEHGWYPVTDLDLKRLTRGEQI